MKGKRRTRAKAAEASSRMLLLAEPGPSREAYERALAGTGVDCVTVDTLREMQESLQSALFGGLLIDVPTLIKSSGVEKRLAHGILEHYPVLRLRFDQASGVIHGLFYGQTDSQGDVIADFVSMASATFTPRAMRGGQREEVILNALIHRAPPGPDVPGERAVTGNASAGGCFLYVCSEYVVGERVWLDFLELADRTPVPALLRWRVEWGKNRVLPGIGVAFEDMTPAQTRELASLLGLMPGSPA